MSGEDQLRTTLSELLDLAHHQVHFAEAKNAALLTLNFALVVGMISVAGPTLVWQWAVAIFTTGTTLAIAAIVSVASFIPRLKPIADRSLKATGNVAFTGDIAAMGSSVFLCELKEKLGAAAPASAYSQDVADQIYVNSRIAATKFRLFKYAAWITICGLVVPSLWIFQQILFGSLKMWS